MNPLPNHEDPSFQMSIQESLKQLSAQLGHPLNQVAVGQLYQKARDLLSDISPALVTLARIAGALLVYQVQEIEVEELIESLHRTDAL